MVLTSCSYCNKEFKRISAIEKHNCIYKQRFQLKSEPYHMIAYQCFLEYYKKYYRLEKTYMQFIRSSYYKTFVEFAQYCIDIKVNDIIDYLFYLGDRNTLYSKWTADSNYEAYIISKIKTESPMNGLSKTLQYAVKYAKSHNCDSQNIFNCMDNSQLCHAIASGRISPWVLYNCNSGLEFLSSLDASQQKSIWQYIDPDFWSSRLNIKREEAQVIKQLLIQAGW